MAQGKRTIVPNPETLCKMLATWDPEKLSFRDVLESAYVGWALAKKGDLSSFISRLSSMLGLTNSARVRQWYDGELVPPDPAAVVRVVARMMCNVKVDFDAPLEEDEEDTTPPASTLHPK